MFQTHLQFLPSGQVADRARGLMGIGTMSSIPSQTTTYDQTNIVYPLRQMRNIDGRNLLKRKTVLITVNKIMEEKKAMFSLRNRNSKSLSINFKTSNNPALNMRCVYAYQHKHKRVAPGPMDSLIQHLFNSPNVLARLLFPFIHNV